MKKRKKRSGIARPKTKPQPSRKKRRVRKLHAKSTRKSVKKKTRKVDRKPKRTKGGKRKSFPRKKRVVRSSPKIKRKKKPVRRVKPLPKTKRKKKSVRTVKTKLETEFPNGVVEGERFITPKLKYEYRQFYLPDFDPATIAGVIENVLEEPKPHPIAFYIHMEYIDKDGGTGDVGTAFFRFKIANAGDASDACAILASQYEIDTITEIEMLATYSVVKGK